MALTWTELEHALGTRYRIVRIEPSWFVLQWIGEGRSIPVRIERGQALEQDWVLVIVDVAPAHSIPSDELLARNLRLSFGSFALERDRIVLRAADVLATTAPEKVIAAIEFLAREAATRRGAQTAALGLFGHLFSE